MQSVQRNIFECNAYKRYLLDFDDKPSFQEKRQVVNCVDSSFHEREQILIGKSEMGEREGFKYGGDPKGSGGWVVSQVTGEQKEGGLMSFHTKFYTL